MARSKLIITCPKCGAANASTMQQCVQCGASLDPIAVPMTAPPPPPVIVSEDDELAGHPAGTSDTLRQAVAHAESQRTASAGTRFSALKKLGSQAIYYVGCAIFIVIPLAIIGIGPLRAMIARIFQH